ncbi:MAG: hypothetical protein ACR2KX_10985, partial [Chitinophagaceae bacterium]
VMDKITISPFSKVVLFAVLWFVTYTICFLTLKKLSPDKTTGIILSFLPVVTFALFIYSIIRGVTSMDEVEIRIQMEAVVIAFSLALLTIMTLGLLDLVVVVNKEDWVTDI